MTQDFPHSCATLAHDGATVTETTSRHHFLTASARVMHSNDVQSHEKVKSAKQQSSPRSALVLYASETGNAQDAAEEVSRYLERLRFSTVVLDLDSIQLRDLIKTTFVVFVVSTAGQGELPQNARSFWRTLVSAALKPGVLRKVSFSSFGLGDSSYPRYNVAHRMLHGRLLQLGAKSFCERGEGNEQHPEGHSAGLREWIVSLRQAIELIFPLEDGLVALDDDAMIEPRWKLSLLPDIDPPDLRTLRMDGDLPSDIPLPLHDGYAARIVSNQRITRTTHFQDTRLLDLHLERAYEYGPGAVAVLQPKNFPEDTRQFIELMDWQEIADQPLQLSPAYTPPGSLACPSPLRHIDIHNVTITIRWLLENVLDIMSIPRRSFFALLSHFAGTNNEDEAYQKERLLELADPQLIDELWDYTTRPKRTILEVMMDFTTIKIPWQYVLHVLPIMRGRQFSIASGGTLSRTETGQTRVQLLVAIVDPPSPIIKWRRRYGVCTRYVASLKAGQRIVLGMQKGYLGVGSTDSTDPVLMIGPGTGVAPMRALIYHHLELAKSRHRQDVNSGLAGDVLYFGCRSAKDDFYFEDEWTQLSAQQGLTVNTAFSRDTTTPKQYVQDLIRADGAAVAETLVDDHGRIFVCGSSGNMPKAVREAILDALEQHEAIVSRSRAEFFLQDLEKSGRYEQETW